MNKHPLIEFLGRHPEYRRLREALMKNEGAAAVFLSLIHISEPTRPY